MQNDEDKLMTEKDVINNERLRWSSHRDNKLQPETVELDEKLERLDPERFAAYQKLERQVSLIVSRVHFDRVGNIKGGLTQEKTGCKRRELHALAHENMDMSVRPCKWKRRNELSEQIWRCTAEEIICETKISNLEADIRKLEPKTANIIEPSSEFDEKSHLVQDKKAKPPKGDFIFCSPSVKTKRVIDS